MDTASAKLGIAGWLALSLCALVQLYDKYCAGLQVGCREFFAGCVHHLSSLICLCSSVALSPGCLVGDVDVWIAYQLHLVMSQHVCALVTAKAVFLVWHCA
jgi:hypothetical protein